MAMQAKVASRLGDLSHLGVLPGMMPALAGCSAAN